MHLSPVKLARSLHFCGIRRNACTQSRRLITRRSQVQILPPLLQRPWKQGLLLTKPLRKRFCKRKKRHCASSRFWDARRVNPGADEVCCALPHVATSSPAPRKTGFGASANATAAHGRPVQISNAQIAASDQALYDLGVSTERERSRPDGGSEQLHGRSHEQLLAKTITSAMSHAIAIRENARREAELTLRKARAEAEKLKGGAERERDDAQRELLRLRRITEQMRSGLSALLTSKMEELRLETEGATDSGQDDELETALRSTLEARSATGLPGSAGGPHAVS
jgi:hypothetical protein